VIRLALRVKREQAELVLAELLELAPEGLEELELPGGVVEYALYGAPGELPELPRLRAAVGGALVELDARVIPDDWPERWRFFHRPVLLEALPEKAAAQPLGAPTEAVRRLHVRPPWEPPCGLPGALEIVIDPGQAFGTGAHHTTRLCLELLLTVRREDPRALSLIDLGTGSGVLAIAARKLGFDPVSGFDSDPESLSAARANARTNDVVLGLRPLDLRTSPLPEVDAATVITANLLRGLLLELARRLPAPPAHLLAGGLLADELDEASEAFRARLGLRERARPRSGEWGALWLTRDPVSSPARGFRCRP
jgi:ribosomal protein L11 methyltransferase